MGSIPRMAALDFRSEVKLMGINPYVIVDAGGAERLKRDWRKPMPVRAWLNGKPKAGWCVNLMPAGDGSYFLYLRGDVRKMAGVQVGDRVTISLRFDEGYKPGPDAMPSWFRNALAANSAAKRGWDALAPSRQKEILRYIAGLKTEDARSRNLTKALRMLSGHAGRYMARQWNSATGNGG
jgi:hypothetical protein